MIAKIGKERFVVATEQLKYGSELTFVELSDLRDEIVRLVNDEESRILQESLSGDYVCDGCSI